MTAEERSERRKDRLARNEALFREVNERVEEVGERAGLDMIDFICECGDADCTAAVSLTESEYEQIRTDPVLFAILPGHAIPEIEDVVSEGDRFQVVRKHEEEEDDRPSDRPSGLRSRDSPACTQQRKAPVAGGLSISGPRDDYEELVEEVPGVRRVGSLVAPCGVAGQGVHVRRIAENVRAPEDGAARVAEARAASGLRVACR